MAREWGRVLYLVAAWLFVVCVVVQFFLAGLGVFAGAQNFVTHREFAYLFGWLSVVMVVAGLVGRMPRRLVLLALVLFGLMALQSVFVAFRTSQPAVAALHPVNGALILLLGLWLAMRARTFVPAPLGTADRAQLAESVR
jgi:hypothetical protein